MDDDAAEAQVRNLYVPLRKNISVWSESILIGLLNLLIFGADVYIVLFLDIACCESFEAGPWQRFSQGESSFEMYLQECEKFEVYVFR